MAGSASGVLDPEEAALRILLAADTARYSRMNTWLVTEGLFLTATAAFANLALNWMALLLISSMGFIITGLWQGVIIRADAVANWYSARAISIHRQNHSQPLPKTGFDMETQGLFSEVQRESFWNGEGINILDGSNAISAVFALVWASIGGYSAWKAFGFSWGWWGSVAFLFWLGYVFYLWRSRKLGKMHDMEDRKRAGDNTPNPEGVGRFVHLYQFIRGEGDFAPRQRSR